jgi:hypothetical protein
MVQVKIVCTAAGNISLVAESDYVSVDTPSDVVI